MPEIGSEQQWQQKLFIDDTYKTTCPYCGVGCGVIVSRDNE